MNIYHILESIIATIILLIPLSYFYVRFTNIKFLKTFEAILTAKQSLDDLLGQLQQVNASLIKQLRVDIADIKQGSEKYRKSAIEQRKNLHTDMSSVSEQISKLQKDMGTLNKKLDEFRTDNRQAATVRK